MDHGEQNQVFAKHWLAMRVPPESSDNNDRQTAATPTTTQAHDDNDDVNDVTP